jgi:lycopene beta-cyclase
MHDYDLILVGGGLSTGLIAARVTALRPGVRVLILEAGPTLGGNHTWSFHATDVTPAQDAWLSDFVATAWDAQDVHFPGYSRRLSTGYRSITSEAFHDALMKLPGLQVLTETPVRDVFEDRVELDDGARLTASCVIDGRGATGLADAALGYQKFVGLEIRTERPHGLRCPIVMDARVEQIDGFRFVYCLPFTADTLLIEDTYYSDAPDLDDRACLERIQAYAADMGWIIAETFRRERGILPIILDATPQMIWPDQSRVARSGMRAGLFQQTTGYSLALAARTADTVATVPQFDTRIVSDRIRRDGARLWAEQSYFRLLNRMIFVAAKPDQRRRIFERFYTLSQPLIERFYAGHFTLGDKVRLLTGRPPIPMHKAFLAFPARSARAHRSSGAAGHAPMLATRPVRHR